MRSGQGRRIRKTAKVMRLGSESLEADYKGKEIVKDYGYFVRVPNPHNDSSIVVLVHGIHTAGVVGRGSRLFRQLQRRAQRREGSGRAWKRSAFRVRRARERKAGGAERAGHRHGTSDGVEAASGMSCLVTRRPARRRARRRAAVRLPQSCGSWARRAVVERPRVRRCRVPHRTAGGGAQDMPFVRQMHDLESN